MTISDLCMVGMVVGGGAVGLWSRRWRTVIMASAALSVVVFLSYILAQTTIFLRDPVAETVGAAEFPDLLVILSYLAGFLLPVLGPAAITFELWGSGSKVDRQDAGTSTQSSGNV